MGPTASPRRRAGLLYAGLVVFVALLLFTARSIQTAWEQRVDEARAEAVFDLVGQRTPPRPTEAPGAMAWLRQELTRYEPHLAGDTRDRYRRFAAAGDRVPDELNRVLLALRAGALDGASAAAAASAARSIITIAVPLGDVPQTSLREQRVVVIAGDPLAMTRRRLRDPLDVLHADARARAVAPIVATASRALADELSAHALPGVPGAKPPRPVRVYAVMEDASLISAPAPDGQPAGDAAVRELTLLSARSGQPAFAPQEFFFRFDPNLSVQSQSSYSGFYLDLGGRGLVSTVMFPIVSTLGDRGVLALDLAFDIDWRAFAAGIDGPVVGAAVSIADARAATWSALGAALGGDGPAPLVAALDALATRDLQGGLPADIAPLRHAVVERAGAVAAFQVSDRIWLLMLFPRSAPAFPWTAIALLGVMLVTLLAGFEFHRRRADDERRKAERALAEKQNLLNTMQVPLVVVDPNDDSIVSSNRAAESLGIRAGDRFADLVAADPAARAHYQRMQTASAEPRRAYGVPVVVRGDDGVPEPRYAVVRSVAVTAPIEALAADERHRLGILFLLDRDADLSLLTREIEHDARHDERRRLAGLLSHGVDTLARVLEHCLSQGADTAEAREFAAWLADYVERRLAVTAWLLDHWDAAPPAAHDSVVDHDQMAATIARFTRVFEVAARDRDLRTRLHWDNGTLSAPVAGAPIAADLDWPAAYVCTAPVRGGVGLFLGEALINAVRHGRPGSTPRVSLVCDRVRRDVHATVENDLAPAAAVDGGEAYGGIAIMTTIARLFGWRDVAIGRVDRRFVVSWRMPASVRGQAGEAE